MQADYSFWRTCNSQDAQCHCDWRLTVYHCEETDTIRWIYVGNATASGVVGVIGNSAIHLHLACLTNSTIFLSNVLAVLSSLLPRSTDIR